MFVPHHNYSWLVGFVDHVRFIGALINPFGIRKGISLARSSGNDAAVLDPEDERRMSQTDKDDSASLSAKSSSPLHSSAGSKSSPRSGALIINADDWGRDRDNTDRIRECAAFGTVSSASAMVFMEDSERAAELAREKNFDTGLHLNLTMAFNASNCPSKVLEHQRKVRTHLLRHRYAKILFHPGLIRSFEYVVAAQLDEY